MRLLMVGGAAVKAADEGDTGKMVVIDRVSDDPYMAATGIYDVHRIANEEKLVPRNWMNKDANNVTKDFVDYIKPLIQGDYQPIMVNGVPQSSGAEYWKKKRKIEKMIKELTPFFARIDLDEWTNKPIK